MAVRGRTYTTTSDPAPPVREGYRHTARYGSYGPDGTRTFRDEWEPIRDPEPARAAAVRNPPPAPVYGHVPAPSPGGKGQDPTAGLADRLGAQIGGIGDRMAADAARRREVEATKTKRLGEVDAMFAGREPFYQSVIDNVTRSGEARAKEWDRGARRSQRFDLLRRGLAGGSADVEVGSRQSRALGDVMGRARSRGRAAGRQARSSDMALRNQMRGDIMQGLQWQGAGGYTPFMAQMPDWQSQDRALTGALLGDIASGLPGGDMTRAIFGRFG